MSENYLAVTIGPIYKTIRQARSTRELWAASYLFSALMREILIASDGKLGTLLSPALDEKLKHKHGAGVYPDRAFWKLNKKEDASLFSGILDVAFEKIASITGLSAMQQQSYLRIYAVQTEYPESYEKSIILELNKSLDVWELQEKFSADKPDVINILENNIQKLYEDGHKQSKDEKSAFILYECNHQNIKRLPSVIELASSDLNRIDQQKYKTITTDAISMHVCEMISRGKKGAELLKEEFKEQDEIVEKLKKYFGDKFRFRHKYVAFIKADGDNMGGILENMKNSKDKITGFSTLLGQFTLHAVDIIVEYGGVPIYAGGDDLLFAVPLQSINPQRSSITGENIFELISKLDEAFPSTALAALASEKAALPTLSYGVSISYYKFPMAEALDAADSALYRAKKFPGKNAVAFEVRKHSGQQFGAVLQKIEKEAYALFFELPKQFGNFGDDAFLTSVMHTLTDLRLLYEDAIKSSSLEFFFQNHFNEKDHNNKFYNYLKSVRRLTEALFAESGDTSKITDTVFATLRFVQFINQPDHE